MVEAEDVSEKRKALVGQTARLIEFLKDLSSARQPKVRDLGAYKLVRWLDDLPESVEVDSGAIAGELLFSIDAVVSEPPPPVPSPIAPFVDSAAAGNSSQAVDLHEDASSDLRHIFDTWKALRDDWAKRDQLITGHRDWYEQLAREAHRIEQKDDEYEVVISTGLLSWMPSPNIRIRNHLLSSRVLVRIDPDTGRIDVVIAPDVTTRIKDRELLHQVVGFDPSRVESVRSDIRDALASPLHEETHELLKRWRGGALEQCREYDPGWLAQEHPTSAATLQFAPALVVRERDTSNLVDYYEQMLAVLSGPDAEAPLGLAQLIAPLEIDERLEWLEQEGALASTSIGDDPLFPLPANPEQTSIIKRLGIDNGVVVQGPPGTGKTHTIANLISALLARGQRVLVTSQKGQALRVLRDKLPDEIKDLCVSMTDVARGGSDELRKSVNAMSGRFGNFNEVTYSERRNAAAERRHNARLRVSECQERIRSLRESETYNHGEISPGYEGTISKVAEEIKRHDEHSWIPLPVPGGTEAALPMSAQEFGELRRLLISETPARLSRRDQSLPLVDQLFTPASIASAVAAEAAATGSASAVRSGLSEKLLQLPGEQVSGLEAAANALGQLLLQLGVEGSVLPWSTTDWRTQALTDAFSGSNAALWGSLIQSRQHLDRARELLGQLGIVQVQLPPLETTGDRSLSAQLLIARRLAAHLSSGKQLKNHFKSDAQKQAEFLLQHSLVNGAPISNHAQAEQLVIYLEVNELAANLTHQWATVGMGVHADRVEQAVASLHDAFEQLRLISSVVSALADLGTLVRETKALTPVHSLERFTELRDAIAAVRIQEAAEAASATLNQIGENLSVSASELGSAPELHELARAVLLRDCAMFETVLVDLDRAHVEQSAQRRCDLLLGRLRDGHLQLAEMLKRTAVEECWEQRSGTFEDAWSWAVARTFFDEQRQPGLDERLEGELADAIARCEAATSDLAAEEAWVHCLSRMTAAHAQALRAYESNVTDRGKGTGKYAGKYEQAAKQAMTAARGAVPAWIMPLAEVLDTIPPEKNSFDVVIIDEASQASIETLFLLWLAPRVIVVGDDRQCTPSQVSHGKLEPIFDKLDDYLRDLPEYLRVGFTPRSSLFSLLQTRFGSTIRLREHFRCMPEIINWSSRQFYNDMPLVPLRQFGADRLDPLRTVYVSPTVEDGAGTQLRNQKEAEALVAQLVECHRDRRYEGLTFGVVVLQGVGQIGLINDLLEKALSAKEWEERRLRIGIPPDFQGDERNVMFLAMVAAERRTSFTKMEYQRRFNVAASRAQDQMWLFHSLPADALAFNDLRRSLITYMEHPPAPQVKGALDDVQDDIPHPDFDSLFEQRVFRMIRSRGFQVTPQYEVNGRRIDLVVTGSKGRLAVECDGEAWHTSPEQRENDLDREQQLKRAGWKFWRVRESEFYFDRDRALNDLWRTLERRGIQPGSRFDESGNPTKDWTAADLSDEDGLDDLPITEWASSDS